MTAGAGSIRAFVALDLDDASIRWLAALSSSLRADRLVKGARWSPSSKMHLTLQFLGDIDAAVVPPLVEALRSVVDAAGGRAARATFGRLSAFPDPRSARVLVIGMEEPSGDLTRLAQAVGAHASRLGVSTEDRAYRPHVTLARMRAPLDVSPWVNRASNAAPLPAFPSLVLYKSDNAPTSAHAYGVLARFSLG
jgi:RNA 2',3'-cyclic 3'-phosphodiesterase